MRLDGYRLCVGYLLAYSLMTRYVYFEANALGSNTKGVSLWQNDTAVCDLDKRK